MVDQFARQKFYVKYSLKTDLGTFALFTAPYADGDQYSIVYRSPQCFAIAIGNFWRDGKFGEAALEGLLDQRGHDQAYDQLEGEFSILIRNGNELKLWTDVLNLNKIYRNSQAIYSSSWLAAAGSNPTIELEQSAAQEYIIYGASHGQETPIKQVTLMHPGQFIYNFQKADVIPYISTPSYEANQPTSLSGAIDVLADMLVKKFELIKNAFPNRVRSALSSGFDSRMILAGLHHVGNRPSLVVYGKDNDVDVLIARQIADGESLDLTVTDKSLSNAIVNKTAENDLDAACSFFDGIPVDGFIDSGIDQKTRLEQNANSHISLNGGGGEIFRNFFYLRDNRFSASDLFDTFYSQCDARLFGKKNLAAEFRERFVNHIAQAAFGVNPTTNQKIDRNQIERLYATFRCKYWMGRNNTVANRYGAFLTPLLDPKYLNVTANLPLSWKYAGKLQSGIITALSPTIAAYPSSYGFSFSEGPSINAQVNEYFTRAKPTWLRPMPSIVRARLRPIKSVSAKIADDYRQRFGILVDEDFGLQLAHFGNPAQLNRAASLNYAMRWLKSSQRI